MPLALIQSISGSTGTYCYRRTHYYMPLFQSLGLTVPNSRNCFAMLLRLIPKRGVRLLWVDAICINQNDRLERESQVANMMRIYSNCSRAIVYLGADIVRRPPDTQFASRHHLDDFDTVMESEGISLSQLLRRRYFSRIWVVQELILPSQVVFLVGDKEFFANCLSPARLDNQSRLNLADCPAPWLRYLANQFLPEESRNLLEALLLTKESKSSDPRDKVFGFLGLLRDPRLGPNYGASPVQVFVGSFLHRLVAEEDVDVLYFSRGMKGCSDCLSWLPLWESSTDIPSQSSSSRLISQTGTTETNTSSDDDLRNGDRLHIVTETPVKHTTGSVSTESLSTEEWQCPFDMAPEPAITVNADSGHITANMIRLFKFTSQPILVSEIDEDGRSLYSIQVFANNHNNNCYDNSARYPKFHFTTFRGLELSHMIKPGFDHFFLMRYPRKSEGELTAQMAGFILRYSEIYNDGLVRRCAWKIVARCSTANFVKSEMCPVSALPDPEQWFADLQITRYEKYMRKILDAIGWAKRHIGPLRSIERRLFTCTKTWPDQPQLIPLFPLILKSGRQVIPNLNAILADTYFRTLDPVLKPVRKGNYVELTVDNIVAETREFFKELAEGGVSYWLYRYERQGMWQNASYWVRDNDHSDSERLYLRVNVNPFPEELRIWNFASALVCFQGPNENMSDYWRMLEEGPDEELDGDVLAPDWPEEWVNGFKIDGATYKITLA